MSVDRRPYLDKINDNPHIPVPTGHTELNSRKIFPNLRHTGLRSVFEPETVIVATPEGRITTDFKQQAYSTLKDIYRDDIELKNREEVFKISHRQFMDDILNDMEEKRNLSMSRRTKYWSTGKSNLGFTEQFNFFQSEDHGKDSSNPPLSPSAMKSRGSTANSQTSYAVKEARKQRAVNRMLLFKSLLDTTEPPKSPHARFGTISVHKKSE